MKFFHHTFPAAIILAATAAIASAESQFAFKKGDHVALIGNSLADRMQYDGWLETLVQSQSTDMELVFRNLGFAGDRVDNRPRSQNVPTLEDHLKICKPDVIFCFFGYNESYAGAAGVEKFKKDLAGLIDSHTQLNFNGKGDVRFVLFSPIAHENLKSRFLPDGSTNNRNLEIYAKAVQAVADEKKAVFVDLFKPSQELYAKATKPLTVNGVHMGEDGNRQLAAVIVEALLKKKVEGGAAHQKLRAAVLDKDTYWTNRYRAPDGNDVWGSRAKLAFTKGQTNGEVLQHELLMWDALTANRDPRVWAVAKGGDLKVDDSNMPKPVPVISNVGGGSKSSSTEKEGSIEYISGQDGIGKMTVAKGFKVNLFADEKMFPDLVNPVQMSVDAKGRLWAAAWSTYPKWEPGKEMTDKLLIFPDDNRDGVADRCITFAKVHNPTGFAFWNGGVIVVSGTDLVYLKDTDGDDVADVSIHLLQGLDTSDTHHGANNLIFGPDGGLYFQRGVFFKDNVESPWQTNAEYGGSGMFRFDPRKFLFSFHAANGPNSHGIAFDHWGYHYATDGTSGNAFQVVPADKGFVMRSLLKKTVRPVPSSGIISSAQFPDANQGNFMICNAIGFLGIKQYSLDRNPTTGEVNGTAVEDLMVSSDKNFRPTDVRFGDDGALYFSDWSNVIIGHMQHNVRDPNRDHQHGRIYRMIAEGRPLSPHVKIAGEPIPALLENLKNKTDDVRYRSQIELGSRDPEEVLKAAAVWLKQFDPKKQEDAHHLLEGLWLYQRLDVKNNELLTQLLASPEPHAVIAAQTVQHYWDGSAFSAGPKKPKANKKPEPEVAKAEAPKTLADGSLAVTIATLVEQMKYDLVSFEAKAGQKVELTFVNLDNMPHNLALTVPGAADEVCAAAVAMGAAGFEKGFLPDSPKILVHSKLLDAKAREIIKFSAPSEPGDYPYVCTFPGHGILMRGVMKVTK